MKILNAIHGQAIGGVDRVFRDYTKVLQQKGHKVALLISDNKYDNYQEFDKITIFKLKNTAQVFDVLKLMVILIFYRPDVMICHSRRIMNWCKILKILQKTRLIKTKTIALNHGIAFEKSVLCDYILSINDEINQMVVKKGFDPAKSFTVQNAIEINQEYRAKSLKNPPVIGIYGRIEMRKGYDVLIKACEILQQQGYDFRLKIGGFEMPNGLNGTWEAIKNWCAESNITEKCQFVGTVYDKQKFFEDVDIFCVPSREEPFGIVILESFLHSTLVISSDTIGGKLLIQHNENGLLFTNEDSKDVATKIIAVLENQNSYNSKTSKAFKDLEDKFSFNSLGKNLTQILQQISQK